MKGLFCCLKMLWTTPPHHTLPQQQRTETMRQLVPCLGSLGTRRRQGSWPRRTTSGKTSAWSSSRTPTLFPRRARQPPSRVVTHRPAPAPGMSPRMSQASPPCRTPQLDGDGPPSSAGCSGLCAGLSPVPASRHSESSSALLPAGPMKVPAAPEPVLHAEGAAQGGTGGMAAGTAPHAFSCPEDIVAPASAGPCMLSEANKS
ncbi:uncharacterized protein LOC130158595 [Falco biarmicus]|uniref:uncharacterized protein LOC130158595 n=1 Tax=Falco biarmicus TaxID=345155 RepID=UPI0024BD2AAF|nr:uncharacterized protein LOC130158595 [Falco biarmicus]